MIHVINIKVYIRLHFVILWLIVYSTKCYSILYISRLTPEMVNCLATVTRISQNAEQQQKSLKDLCEQSHRKLGQLFSLKQFELGLAKVGRHT